MRLAQQWTATIVLALMCVGLLSAEVSPAGPLERPNLLVTVGEALADHAMLWVRGDNAAPVRVRYGVADHSRPMRETEIVLAPNRDNTGRVSLGPLTPGTRYAYDVSQGDTRVQGTFASPPRPDADTAARLVWSGDLGGSGHCRDLEEGYAIFRAMARHRPDLFLFVGDTVYTDHRCSLGSHVPGADYVAKTLAEFHGKHRYNRADPALQEFFRSTSVYAIWDDHEVRNNFAGPTEPLMPVGLQALLDYWPIEGPAHDPRRLYRAIRWGRHLDIFVLDTRQYRSDQSETDGPAKTMLGSAQREWLLRALAASDATWKLVVTSVPLGQFTGGRYSDSWSNANLFGYPRATAGGYVYERDTILRFVRDRAIRNVVFVSGDVHHAELIRHEPSPGFVVHEFLAGPLAARLGYPRFLDRSLNSRSLGSLGFSSNFGELVVDGEALQVRIFDETDTLRASLRLVADEALTQTARSQTGKPRRAQR
jgi:alkaline phosphatase D